MNLLKYIFSSEFLFFINRVIVERVDYGFLYFSLGLLVLGLVAWLFKRRYKRANPLLAGFFARLVNLFTTVGILGVLWFGVRYEAVRWLGTHFAFLLILLVALVWLGFILKYRLLVYPKERQKAEKEAIKNKYLSK